MYRRHCPTCVINAFSYSAGHSLNYQITVTKNKALRMIQVKFVPQMISIISFDAIHIIKT